MLRKQYSTIWKKGINNQQQNPVLRTYCMYKHVIEIEPYLTCGINGKYKKCISKLRVSSHQLAIETGRHQRPPVPRENRLCKFCSSSHIDDEIHLITNCEFHQTERYTLYTILKDYVPNLDQLDNKNAFITIMTNSYPEVILALGKYIYQSFLKRQQLLAQKVSN